MRGSFASADVLTALEPVEFRPGGLDLHLSADWCVAGEDRLSFVTLFYLAECYRDWLWRQVDPAASLDVAGRKVEGKFRRSLIVPGPLILQASLTRLWKHGYTLAIRFSDAREVPAAATITIDCAFFDPTEKKAIKAPPTITDALTSFLPPNPSGKTQ